VVFADLHPASSLQAFAPSAAVVVGAHFVQAPFDCLAAWMADGPPLDGCSAGSLVGAEAAHSLSVLAEWA